MRPHFLQMPHSASFRPHDDGAQIAMELITWPKAVSGKQLAQWPQQALLGGALIAKLPREDSLI